MSEFGQLFHGYQRGQKPEYYQFLIWATKCPEVIKYIEDLNLTIQTLCESLTAAHDEILRLQGMEDIEKRKHYDWPEWSHCANSVRMAEKLMGRKLAKTDLWTLFPQASPGSL